MCLVVFRYLDRFFRKNMQNLTIAQIQNKPVFSGNKNGGVGNLSVFTDPEVKTHEEKKRNTAIKKALGIAGGVALVGILLSPKFIPHSAKNKIMQKIKGMENEKLKNTMTNGLEYFKNIGINFTGVKDNFCDKLKDTKIVGKPYSWLLKKSSWLYTTGGVSTAKKVGAKPRKYFSYLAKNASDIKGKLDPAKLAKEVEVDGVTKTLGTWLDDITKLSTENASDFAKKFSADEVDKIAKGLNNSFEGMGGKYRSSVISRFKKGNWRDLYKVSIYDDLYSNKAHAEAIENLVEGSLKNNSKIKSILSAIKNSGEIGAKDMYGNLDMVFSCADKSTKKCKDFFSVDLFEKLREIKGGNAATDFIFTVGVPLGGYLFANSKAKTKEDKTSLALTTGIPFALGIGGMVFSTYNVIAGWKAMVIGGIITAISSIAGKTADKIYRKNHNLEESTLPTFNLPDRFENSGLAKTVETGIETVLNS